MLVLPKLQKSTSLMKMKALWNCSLKRIAQLRRLLRHRVHQVGVKRLRIKNIKEQSTTTGTTTGTTKGTTSLTILGSLTIGVAIVHHEDGHFKKHKDTPRGADMVGTLVVCLLVTVVGLPHLVELVLL